MDKDLTYDDLGGDIEGLYLMIQYLLKEAYNEKNYYFSFSFMLKRLW